MKNANLNFERLTDLKAEFLFVCFYLLVLWAQLVISRRVLYQLAIYQSIGLVTHPCIISWLKK